MVPTRRLEEVPRWDFSDRLRKIRRTLDMSQDQFADLLGVSKVALGQWEAGRNRPRNIVDIATAIEDATGVEAGWVLGLHERTSRPEAQAGGLGPSRGNVRPTPADRLEASTELYIPPRGRSRVVHLADARWDDRAYPKAA